MDDVYYQSYSVNDRAFIHHHLDVLSNSSVEEKEMIHFTLEEFTFSQTAERLGIDNSLNTQTLKDSAFLTLHFLETIREVCGGHSVYVNSGYRCLELNKVLRGAKASQHKRAEAADILIPRHGSPKKVCETILSNDIEYDQLIFEGKWVHVSRAKEPRGIVLTASFTSQGVIYHEGIV